MASGGDWLGSQVGYQGILDLGRVCEWCVWDQLARELPTGLKLIETDAWSYHRFTHTPIYGPIESYKPIYLQAPFVPVLWISWKTMLFYFYLCEQLRSVSTEIICTNICNIITDDKSNNTYLWEVRGFDLHCALVFHLQYTIYSLYNQAIMCQNQAGINLMSSSMGLQSSV